MSLMFMLNIRGPSIDPCGTPENFSVDQNFYSHLFFVNDCVTVLETPTVFKSVLRKLQAFRTFSLY